jgi:F-type H+-transporting ATPase subunit a
MAAGSNAPTSSEYIVHHLGHLNTSGKPQTNIVDFSIVNIDTVFWSVLLAVLAGWMMYSAAKKVGSGVPGRFVGAIESLVEFVHEQARSIVHGDVRHIAPLALTAFVWIIFMNAMDLVPLDVLPWIGEHVFGLHYMRVVPTADLNATMAMSLVVISATLYYGIKIKHPGGFLRELVSAPFGTSKNPIGALILGVLNLGMQFIEYLARLVSLGMRLFGNMFAGELVFMLIALMGGAFSLSLGGLLLGAGHVVFGAAWAIFHILIVLLQGFIFMMLTLVYMGQAHEGH